MNNIYISIVSHNHDEMIINNIYNEKIAAMENVIFIIKDNVSSKILSDFCIVNNILYIDKPLYVGFGENNNVVFDYAINNGMEDSDWFAVINPDVIITDVAVENLLSSLSSEKNELLTINLYQDLEKGIFDNSLRKFPTWRSFFNLFLGKPANVAYDKIKLSDKDKVDWAAGSFLIFKASLYKKLKGFSNKYFMYYEDVDICYRAKKNHNQSVSFLKNIKAVHIGAYANRKIFSKHFRWYLKSFLTFLLNK